MENNEIFNKDWWKEQLYLEEVKIHNPLIKRWDFTKYIPDFNYTKIKIGDILIKKDSHGKIWEFNVIDRKNGVVVTKEIGELTKNDFDRWNRQNKTLEEVKIQNPTLKSPFIVKSPEEWEKIRPILMRKGYKFRSSVYDRGLPLDMVDMEDYPFGIYLHDVGVKDKLINYTSTPYTTFDNFRNKELIYNIFENEQSNTLYDEFINFVESKLGLENLKQFIKLTTNKEDTQTFAHFNPSNNEIVVYVKDRVNGDWMRSLAHECVHFLQNKNGVLTPESGKDGHEHENEANSKAGVIMREFGRKHPEIFTTKYEENINEINLNNPTINFDNIKAVSVIAKKTTAIFVADQYMYLIDLGGYYTIIPGGDSEFHKILLIDKKLIEKVKNQLDHDLIRMNEYLEENKELIKPLLKQSIK